MDIRKKSDFLEALSRAAKQFKWEDNLTYEGAALKAGFRSEGTFSPILLDAIKKVFHHECGDGLFFPVYIACEAAWEFFQNDESCHLDFKK